jgi:flagellar biosynthetic protein FliR
MTTTFPFWTIEPRHVQLAMLAMIRLSGFLVLVPPVQSPLVPVSVRVGLAFSLLFLLWNGLAAAAPPIATSVLALAGLAVSELTIGVAIGFAARLVLAAASFAAELVGIQMGFGLAALLDPLRGEQSGVLTRLFDWTVMVLFLALDGHHLLIGATVESFRVVPPGHAADLAAGLASLLPLGGRLFGVGMALVAPALGVLFLANVVLVLVTRAVPHLNLMAVAFPILILLGLGMAILNLDLLAGIMGGEIRNLEGVLVTVLRSFAHGG